MSGEERREVFRGHLEECLRHLQTALNQRFPKGAKGTAEAKKPLADFCDVAVPTVTRWFHGKDSLPIGEERIKLMCYLDLFGYRVIELERMQKVRRNFGDLIGFGLITSQEATELLGYTSTSSLFKVLAGSVGAGDDKDAKMWDIWKERKEELEKKKEKSYELYGLDIGQGPQPGLPAAVPAKRADRSAAVVHVMEGLLIMLEDGSCGELPAKARSTVLRLSAQLSNLSSKLIMSGEQKGGS